MSKLIIPIEQYARTAAQLATENPILLDKQLVIESDTGKMKLGNGTTAYNSLPYLLVSGTTSQYVRGDGSLATFPSIPSITGLVPYTGANANVNLGAFDLTADVITGATGSYTSSGNGNTLEVTHLSGSGIALNITKGGNGEGLYINKTSGSGNAATIIGTLNATTLVKSGGTSSQFLKADGSIDSTAYYPNSNPSGFITSAALSGYIQGSGTTNYIPKFTASGTVGNSTIFTNATNVSIGSTTLTSLFNVGTSAQFQVNSSGAVIASTLLSSQASGTESSNYRLNSITLGYDATNLYGWITAGGAAARAPLVLNGGSGANVGINTSTTLPFGALQIDRNITYPNATNNSADAYSNLNKSHIKLQSNNNALMFGVDSVTNSRFAWIQSGHFDPAFATSTGTLLLNPFGGNIAIGKSSASYLVDSFLNANAQATINITNTNTGNAAFVHFRAESNAGVLSMYNFGSGYSTSGRFIASSAVIDFTGTNGASISASNTVGIIRFYTNANNERMRISSNGNVLIGTTTDNGAKLQVNGGASFVLPTSAAGLPSGALWNNGGVVNIV